MARSMGQIIKMLRKEHHMTQEELASRIGVTYQAVSKWENDAGMPDISQIVPLASVFHVTTDVLFGIDRNEESEDVTDILARAEEVKEYGKRQTYLTAYDILKDGIRKYPCNLMLINHAMNLGSALALPENGWLYAEDRAQEIFSDTVQYAGFIIDHSKIISDVLRARQCLIFLYSAHRHFDLAMAEAYQFPPRSDFTLYSHLARVNEYMGNHEHSVSYLCSDLDYALQSFEDNIARLGMAYYHSGHYADAIKVYEMFFAIMNIIFSEEYPPPYHDFDSGDCYLLLAKAYLANGENDKAMDAVEKSVSYYLRLLEKEPSHNGLYQIKIDNPFLKKTELRHDLRKSVLKKKLLEKLADNDIQSLCKTSPFIKLSHIVNNISE